jgi:hypothetical protein
MATIKTTPIDPATERLASEVADVRASIAMIRSGVATNITLTGLRFSQQLAERLGAAAAAQGVLLEASFWPEEENGDLHVTTLAGRERATESGWPDPSGAEAEPDRRDGLDR